MRTFSVFSVLWLVACDGGSGGGKDTTPATAATVDADGDGYNDHDDCDDADAEIHPSAPEVCDAVDNDCDGLVDDADDSLSPGGATLLYTDSDGDGYGDPDAGVLACAMRSGLADNDEDCDDTTRAASPEAAEICDGIDNDCDQLLDEQDDSLTYSADDTWYADLDGDGHGNAAGGSGTSCVVPPQAAASDDDCNDSDPSISPSAIELCNGIDEDCAGGSESGIISTGGQNYTTLQDAVDATADGDTIRICSGNYHDTALDIRTEITLVSTMGAVLRGTTTDAIITLADATALTVQGLYFSDGDAVEGGAIDGGIGSDITVEGCTFEDNTGIFGGAISIAQATLTVRDSTFEGNTAQGRLGGAPDGLGGAIAGADSDIVLEGVTFKDNASYFGGAVGIQGGTLSADADTLFQDNIAETTAAGDYGFGGGIYALDAALVLDADTEIIENTAQLGGGFLLWSSEMAGGTVTNNEAFAAGGGQLFESAALSGATLSGNTATEYGGGLVFSASDNTVSDTLIDDNTAPNGGGAFGFSSTGDVFDGVTISGNTATDYGGGLIFNNDVEATGFDLELTDNSADYGGGAMLFTDSVLVMVGGAVRRNTAATSGGGVGLSSSEYEADGVDMGDSSLTDNDPNDVFISNTGRTYDYGDDTTVVCATSCR